MLISSIDYKQHLSEARRAHSEAVAQTALMLATRHRLPLAHEEIILASHYHDLCREWEDDALLAYVEQESIVVTAEERNIPVLLHGPVAADILKQAAFPPAVTLAIRHHSLGSPTMGLLGLVLYIADALAPDRPYRSKEEREMLLAIEPIERVALAIIEAERIYRGTISEATAALAAHLQSGGRM